MMFVLTRRADTSCTDTSVAIIDLLLKMLASPQAIYLTSMMCITEVSYHDIIINNTSRYIACSFSLNFIEILIALKMQFLLFTVYSDNRRFEIFQKKVSYYI